MVNKERTEGLDPFIGTTPLLSLLTGLGHSNPHKRERNLPGARVHEGPIATYRREGRERVRKQTHK